LQAIQFEEKPKSIDGFANRVIDKFTT